MMVKGILEDCGADAAAAASKAIPERKEKLLGTMAFWPTFKAVSVDWKELVKLVRQGVDKLLALKGYNSKEIKITKQRIGEYQGVRYMARNNNLRESEERGEQMQKLPVKRGTQERKYPVIGDDQDKRRDNFGPVRADQQSAGSGGQERQQQSHRRDDRQNFNNNRADSRPLIRRQGNEGGQQQNTSRNESRPLVRRPGGNDGGQRQSSPVKSNSQLQRESRPTQQQQTQKGRLPMDWRSRGI
ncbi:hypothetical protein BZA77DRAFT_298725 [Pyronema omphalodes]|nr:hypothetical protein BZA77DRAFT_298725 [Pyronema omphalodes]